MISMQYAPADVVEQCRRALELPGVPAGLRIQLLSVLSFGLDLGGDAAAAAVSATRAAAAAAVSGDPADEVLTLVPRSANALAAGDWRAAIALVSEAEATIEMADEIGDRAYGYVNHMGLYILGRVALHTGDAAGLALARTSAARLGEAPGCPASQRLGAWLSALIAHADGDAAAAAAAGPGALDPLASGPLPSSSPRAYADLAAVTRILLDAGQQEDARAVVDRLEGFVGAHPDFPFARPAALHARAVLDGDGPAALRAAARASDDPRPLVRAAVLEDAGRLPPAARAKEAVTALARALEAYSAAGAERDAARVRAAMRARGARPPSGGPRPAARWRGGAA